MNSIHLIADAAFMERTSLKHMCKTFYLEHVSVYYNGLYLSGLLHSV